MASAEAVNRELVEDVNNHLNSLRGELEQIHSDVQELITIEEREADELSPQEQRAFPDEERAVMKINRVLDELETILDEGVEAIINMERWIDVGDSGKYDTGDTGIKATVNYIRVIAELGKHTIEALQVQIKFEAEVENINRLKNGEVELSDNQRQYIQTWIQDCLEILEDVKDVLEKVLDFGEQMLQKHEDENDLLRDYMEEYRGNIIGGEIERIEREEDELRQLAQNI